MRPPAKCVAIADWPEADRTTWSAACRPAVRLAPGGRAGHLKSGTRQGLVRVYGQFLAQCQERPVPLATNEPGTAVTVEAVQGFLTALDKRVGSVTVAGYIYRLYRMARILNPGDEWGWLREIWLKCDDRKQRRSLSHRLVASDRLYRAGLSVMREAETNTRLCPAWRAARYRNGLMVALLSLHPIRLANLHGLRIGRTLLRQGDEWWIVLPASETKGRRYDERPLGPELSRFIDCWIEIWRPTFNPTDDSLWPSPQGGPLAYTYVGTIVTRTVEKELGIPVNPHMFRSCTFETVVSHLADEAAIASALLHHADPETTRHFYDRGKARSAFGKLHAIVEQFNCDEKTGR